MEMFQKRVVLFCNYIFLKGRQQGFRKKKKVHFSEIRKEIIKFLSFDKKSTATTQIGVAMEVLTDLTSAIRQLYEIVLRREPESDDVILHWINSNCNFWELLENFLSSDEYRQLTIRQNMLLLKEDYLRNPDVEIHVSEEQYRALCERVIRQWTKLGEEDPYWSVLTHPAYQLKNIDEARLATFYEQGLSDSRALAFFCKKNNVPFPHGRCLELGCGVGRITLHLAPLFDEMYGVDISAGNLAICSRLLASRGVNNVKTILLQQPDDLQFITDYQCFFSVIVLQHNPPPIQYSALKHILTNLSKGGIFFFQLQANYHDYSFNFSEYINSSEIDFDMHCLPMNHVLELINSTGCVVKDIVMDHWTGMFGSYTFFGTKML